MKHASRPIVIGLALGAVSILGAAHAQGGDLHHTVVPGNAITWGQAPPSLPAGAQGETIVQINGTGPFDVKYGDPKDDPRTK